MSVIEVAHFVHSLRAAFSEIEVILLSPSSLLSFFLSFPSFSNIFVAF